MFNLKSVLLIFTTLLISATAEHVVATTDTTLPSPNAKTIVPFDPVGDVVAVQGSLNKPTLIIYQHRLGHLVSVEVKGAFSTGVTRIETIVPAERVLYGTPIAVGQAYQSGTDPGLTEFFFFDKNYILSEVRWNQEVWTTGAGCPGCVDQTNHFQAAYYSSALYVMGTSTPSYQFGMRVGFKSIAYPDGLTEAQRIAGVWNLAPLTQTV